MILDHVDCGVANAHYEKYLASDRNDEKYRYTKLGKFTIDNDTMVAFLSSDPSNEDEQYAVQRAETYHREIRSDHSRFNVDIAAESLKVGNETESHWIAT